MKIVGLITEYNPFHNGHLYHLEQAKKLANADYAIIVMSGNFLQRGEPAIIDKYARTKMALTCGGDLVLELPVYYACASAEYFAFGAVSLLNSLGVVDSLCFGSECPDMELLDAIASILMEEPLQYKENLKKLLSEGVSFPFARSMAVQFFMEQGAGGYASELLHEVLHNPNNILALEYLKALKKLNSTISPIAIKRISNHYHDFALGENISSATAIRKKITENTANTKGSDGDSFPEQLVHQVPPSVYQILEQEFEHSFPVVNQDLSKLLHYKLLSIQKVSTLAKFFDVSEDLARRIWNLRYSYTDVETFTTKLKTRQYTQTRISRAMLHILLDIKAIDIKVAAHLPHPVPYIRVLGFRQSSGVLLSEIKKQSTLPILSKLADASAVLTSKILDNDVSVSLKMLEKDIYCSHIYHSVITEKFQDNGYNEYSMQIVRV